MRRSDANCIAVGQGRIGAESAALRWTRRMVANSIIPGICSRVAGRRVTDRAPGRTLRAIRRARKESLPSSKLRAARTQPPPADDVDAFASRAFR